MHDLSHPIEPGMQIYPGDPAVTVDPAATHERDGVRVSRLTCGSHAGTHVDAPAHTERDGRTLGTYDVAAFVRDAITVDCRDLDDRAPIPAARVPTTDADCVVFRTGWDAHWGTDRYRDHPYLSPAAARRCADLGVAVGIDALSPDPTPPADATGDGTENDPAVPAHRALLGAECLIFENLANLGAVPERFELRAYPLALDADGAPVRAVGCAPDVSPDG